MNWALSSILAAIAFAGLVLTYKKLLLLGMNSLVLNVGIFGLVFAGFASFLIIKKVPFQISGIMIALLLLGAVFSFIGNYMQVKAYQDAPNPGYASTIVAAQLILITIFSVFLYHSELNALKFIGIAIVILGSFIIAL